MCRRPPRPQPTVHPSPPTRALRPTDPGEIVQLGTPQPKFHGHCVSSAQTSCDPKWL